MTDALSRELDALLHRCQSRILRLAHGHAASHADLDEIMQQVRIRVWQAVPEAERISRLPASYVYRVVRAVLIDRMRRRRVRGEHAAIHLDAAPEEAMAKTQPDPVERDEAAATLERAVGTLAESRRGVVRMYLAGYTQREIGQLFGWSEPKTRNLLYRGLADLRAQLAPEGAHDA